MKHKLHLCLDLRLIKAPGIGRFLKTIMLFFLEDNTLSVSFLCYEEDLNAIEVLDKKHKSEKILCKSSIYSLKEQWELMRKIPKCDIFWAPHFNIPLLTKKAKSLIVTIHDVFFLTHLAPLYQRCYARMMYFFLNKRANFITTCSSFTRDQYLAFLGNGRAKDIFKIYYAVTYQGETIVSVEQRENIILYVGSLQKRKNLFLLMKAYSILQPKEKLVIIGPKTGRSIDTRIFALVEENTFLKNNVIFVNLVSDEELIHYYSLAKVFVFPSIYEGFGYPPLEAMKHGTPVVASDISCLREICGDAALFFNPYEEKDIARVLSKILKDSNLQQYLQSKGIDHVKKYSLSKMKDLILRVIYENSSCS